MTAQATRHVIRAAHLVAAGFERHEIARLVRRGDLERLRHGAFTTPGDRDERADHRLRAIAVALGAPNELVISHVSALVMHGVALGRQPLDRVHLTYRGVAESERAPGVHRHAAIPGSAPLRMGPVLVAPLAEALIDSARTGARRFDGSDDLIAGDDALHRGLVTPEDLAIVLPTRRNRQGVGHARRVVALMDGRHESPGETRLAVSLRSLGVASTPQVEVQVGRTTYRLDRLLDDAPVAVEFDGQVKYADPSALFAEKQREDAIRSLGIEFVRVTWAQVGDLRWLASQLSAARTRTLR